MCELCVRGGSVRVSPLASAISLFRVPTEHHFKLLVEAQSQPAPPTGVFWFCAQTARTSSRHRQPRPTLRVRQSPGCEPGRAARSGRRNRGPLHAGAWRRAPWPRARATPMVSTPHHPSAKTGTGQPSRQRCRVMRPGKQGMARLSKRPLCMSSCGVVSKKRANTQPPASGSFSCASTIGSPASFASLTYQ